MSRQKTGGRKVGTPNRRTADVEEKLAAMGCDPIEGMARIAMDEATDIGLRARMYQALAEYLFPKRKAVDVVSGQDRPQTLEEIVLRSFQPRSYPLMIDGKVIEPTTLPQKKASSG